MYEITVNRQGLGFSLLPPKSIRAKLSAELKTVLQRVAGAVLKGTQVSVPTPVGTQTFDLGNPADVAILKQMATGIRFGQAAPEPTSPVETAKQMVSEHVPGGFGGLALIGAGLLALVLFSRRRG